MGGPGEGRGKVGEHVVTGEGEGVENEFARPNVVAGISVIEETFSDIQGYLKKNRQKQEVCNRRYQKRKYIFLFNQLAPPIILISTALVHNKKHI